MRSEERRQAGECVHFSSLLTPHSSLPLDTRIDICDKPHARLDNCGPGLCGRPGRLGDVMAGSTAPTAVDQASAGPTWRGLWQAPAFVLGVAALTAVVLMRPLLASGDAAAPLKRDLAEARRLLEHPGGDPEQAAKLAQRVLDAKDRRPELAGQADLLLGTARMKQALNAEGDRAAELWAEARQCLEDAQKETVPEGDKGRLQLRLGVVGFYTHDDLNHVIALITPAVEESDDAVLGYTVLTQAYLQLPTPNVATALKLNLALRNRPEATEEVLAPARLLGGELELKLNKPEEARRVLENLGPKATPEMKAKALRLCARSYQGEGNWPEAAARWDKALADDKANGEALYNLGLCAQHQGQGADAAHDWEQCVQAGGDEGRTAALALADMRLKGPNPETALEMFAKVVDGVKPGDDWPGRLTDRASVVKLFQDAGKAYLDNHQFDAAVRLADSFAAVAGPGEAEVLRGKASAAWARFCREQAKQGPAAGQAGAEAQARQLFLKAAAAYAAAAEQAPNDPVPGEYLWQSARCSWEARDLPQASARLEQVTKYAPTPEEIKQDWYVQRMGEACYLLGETRRALHDGDGAAEAYRQCITKQTLFAYRARYRLAMAAMAAGKLDDARDGLEYTLKLLHTADRDAEAEEQTLFALGEIYYRSGKYQQVVEKLGAAVERLPDQPRGDAGPLLPGRLLPPPGRPEDGRGQPRRRDRQQRQP